MLPSNGFLPQGQHTNSAMLNEFLPVPFEGTYTDTSEHGSPNDIVTRKAGFSLADLQAGGRKFKVTLRQRGTHGVVLVDRIE